MRILSNKRFYPKKEVNCAIFASIYIREIVHLCCKVCGCCERKVPPDAGKYDSRDVLQECARTGQHRGICSGAAQRIHMMRSRFYGSFLYYI